MLVNARVLQALFALMLVYATYSMGRRTAAAGAAAATVSCRPATPSLGRGRLHTACTACRTGMVASFFAGNLSGLLGVGGGVIQVPVMSQVMGVPIKAALATSNFMLGVTAATSAALYFGRGFIEPKTAVPTALGVLVGAQLGPRLAGRLPRAHAARAVPGAARRVRRADGLEGAGAMTDRRDPRAARRCA